MSERPVTREHERIAFLEELTYDEVLAYLSENAIDLGPDNKTSYFFALPDVNVSVAVTEKRAVLKYKGGQLGRGVGFEELEIKLATKEEAEKTVHLLEILTDFTPQLSQQIRRNYQLDDVELAVKYTETWGFHVELEKLYEATDEELTEAARVADERIASVAGRLGIKLATNQELIEFTEAFKINQIPRGEYKAEEVIELYNTLQKQAAIKRLPDTQKLDEASIRWIEQGRTPEASVPHELLNLSDAEKLLLTSIELPAGWFTSPERRETIHGQLHLARVAAFASHLARESGHSDTAAQTLFVAGLLHDIARDTDKTDEGHGARSAEWVLAHRDEIQAELGGITEDIDWELLNEVVTAHDEESVPSELTATLKTADALDRYRLPKQKWWINDDYLTAIPSNELKSLAFDTILTTEKAWLAHRDLRVATSKIVTEE